MNASVWSPESIRDVAESVGITNLPNDAQEGLARDVEFRITLVMDEALKFMRHARRTTLTTQDISHALRILDVEPLYGYESTRPLRFGEASIGPGQPLFYIEDEEVDFEKLINAPLPKVPRELTLTAHWLAVDGVQPSIPQNPTSASTASSELLPKGPGAPIHLAALNGYDNVSIKPLVKHIVSKELQLYFDRICSAVLDEANDEYRSAAFASIRTDPGLHQLIAYFINFVQEKVTHSQKNLFVLTQMMHLTAALLANPSLYIEPYITSVIPSVLTCVLGKHLGTKESNATSPPAHYALRDLAASLLSHICRHYSNSSQTLKPRIARTLMKNLLDPTKPFAVHYGALTALLGVIGTDGIVVAVLSSFEAYDALLKDGLADETKKADAEIMITAILKVLQAVEREFGFAGTAQVPPDAKEKVIEKVGEVIGEKVMELGRPGLIKAVLDAEVSLEGRNEVPSEGQT
ncbi:TAF-domain-containing protein [Rhizodiscina lignyota]|uniref:TBP-associated factor 6 n=1 Tax=Rhizodiscina lignyota TaxID=1504668 RepID=A0A9P4IAE8_9PEZI|nr:TAF-domain-containing protein [Rhizodiscina lignyota]